MVPGRFLSQLFHWPYALCSPSCLSPERYWREYRDLTSKFRSESTAGRSLSPCGPCTEGSGRASLSGINGRWKIPVLTAPLMVLLSHLEVMHLVLPDVPFQRESRDLTSVCRNGGTAGRSLSPGGSCTGGYRAAWLPGENGSQKTTVPAVPLIVCHVCSLALNFFNCLFYFIFYFLYSLLTFQMIFPFLVPPSP